MMDQDAYLAGENSDSSERGRHEEEEEEIDSHMDVYNIQLSRLLDDLEKEREGRPSKDVYVGGRDEDGLPHGQGCILYCDTMIRYEGEWKNGVPEGRGRIRWRNGSRFEGQVAEGKPFSGVLRKQDGSMVIFEEGSISQRKVLAADDEAAARQDIDEYEKAKQELFRAQNELERISTEVELKEAKFSIEQSREELEFWKQKLAEDSRRRKEEVADQSLQLRVRAVEEGGAKEERTFTLHVDVPLVNSSWQLERDLSSLRRLHETMHALAASNREDEKFRSLALPSILPSTSYDNINASFQQYFSTLQQLTSTGRCYRSALYDFLQVHQKMPDPTLFHQVQSSEGRRTMVGGRSYEIARSFIEAFGREEEQEMAAGGAGSGSRHLFALMSGLEGEELLRAVQSIPGFFPGITRALKVLEGEVRFNLLRSLTRILRSRHPPTVDWLRLRLLRHEGLLESIISCMKAGHAGPAASSQTERDHGVAMQALALLMELLDASFLAAMGPEAFDAERIRKYH
uniref:Uncharacterized protein n=1 Tax=Guillardia theta TaxID=55529 RepID=A0A7S4PR39_GUITH|mmetsp:Transcript_9232/g.30833  ORF Transcript_9232/g.30833 Transcript_9232/m.30833 type:complete len:515 (+) Transcript_9232:428-1972(+)